MLASAALAFVSAAGRSVGAAPGSRSAVAPPSDAELVEPVVVDPEVMGELVDHGQPDLVGEVVRVREVLLERQPEERDPVRDGATQSAPYSVRGTPS